MSTTGTDAALSFRKGILDALMAAAEEHDRDEYEVICPKNVNAVEPVFGGIRVSMNDGSAYLVQTQELNGPSYLLQNGPPQD